MYEGNPGGNWFWFKLAWSSSCRRGLKIKYQYVKQRISQQLLTTITCGNHYMNKIKLTLVLKLILVLKFTSPDKFCDEFVVTIKYTI